MRIVRWEPQQRVDVPDKVAENFLVLGEFRRLVRALIVGNDVETARIVNGFKVVATGPVSAQVEVKLDPGGVPYGVAVGAENLGYLDWGQVIGDKDHYDNLEGNATYSIDFTAEAAGTYSVWMRFVYAEGENDNRAFWNPTTDAEVINSTDTRHLPAFEFAIAVSSPGAEYAQLAEVVWGGSTISSGNITDKREMLFEGAAPNYQTTQSGTGGMPDFVRTTPRADNVNDSVYNVLRRIGRQIQDLKGPNASGNWDFFSRPIKPMDPNSLLGSGVTKSIATLDSLEYTIGDGTTTWGDFSGATALQSCLTHIQSSQANLPQRIRIRLKSRRTAISDTAIWSITNGLNLSSTKHIEIIGDLSGTDQAAGRVPIAFSDSATSFLFSSSTASSLTLKNIKAANVPAASLFLGGDSGRIHLDNVLLCSQNVAISANCTQSIWRNSEVYGAIHVSADSVYQDIDGFHMENCRFGANNLYTIHMDGYFRFWRGPNNLIVNATTFSSQVTATNCEFFYAGNTLPASPAREGCIDLRGSSEFVFSNCNFSTWADSDCIRVGNSDVDVANGSARILFDTCRFTVGGLFTSVAAHDVDLGYNTTEGTGWAIYGNTQLSTTTITSALTGCFMRAINCRNCTWSSCAQIDAGGIKLKNGTVSASVENCRFEGVVFPVDTGFSSLRRLQFVSFTHDAQYTNYTSAALNVSNCAFGRVSSSDAAADVPNVRHVNLTRVTNVHVSKCSFVNSTQSGSSNKTVWSNGTSEMAGVQMSRCFDVYVDDCTFAHFPGTGLAAGIVHTGTDTTPFASRFTVKNCHFENSAYGFYLRDASSSLITFEGNTFDAAADSASRLFKANTNLHSTSVLRFLNNTVVNDPGALWTVVQVGDVARVIFTGNDLSVNGRVIHDSGMPGFVVGWNTTPQMNLVSAWA